MTVSFCLYGEPRGKQRPRVAGGHAYTPKETREYECALRTEYMNQCGYNFEDRQVQIRIMAFYKIPKSATKAQREMMLNYCIRPTRKPDVDNVLKIVADALNGGIAYNDDKQIDAAVVEKFYSEEPRVLVYITDDGIHAIA